MNRNLRALVEQEVKGSGSGMTISSAAALATRHANTAAFASARATKSVLKTFKKFTATKSEKDYAKVMMDIFDLLLELDKAAEAAHLATSAASMAINAASDAEAKSLEKSASDRSDEAVAVMNNLR
jgi:hypothetical protein